MIELPEGRSRNDAVSKPRERWGSPALLVSIQPAFANALRAAHTGLTQPAAAGELNSPVPKPRRGGIFAAA